MMIVGRCAAGSAGVYISPRMTSSPLLQLNSDRLTDMLFSFPLKTISRAVRRQEILLYVSAQVYLKRIYVCEFSDRLKIDAAATQALP